MEAAAADRTGCMAVEMVRGRSTVTRCFAKYPLKLIVPRKAGSSRIDAVWIYALTYGGGIVSGDCVSCEMSIGDGCTAVFTTQASTKVYKSLESKSSEQILEATVGSNALLAVVPHPVTCFSTARYSQKQIFRIASNSNLIVVDWFTSGRHESGEKWSFWLYKSTNNILLAGDEPLFLDSVLLEQGDTSSIAERMHDYQVIAMIILIGPRLKHIRDNVQDNVKKMMSGSFHIPNPSRGSYARRQVNLVPAKPALIASCSTFGPEVKLSHTVLLCTSLFVILSVFFNQSRALCNVQAIGTVVRVAALTTESVYEFLRHQLVGVEALVGARLYGASS